jgi:hypothetical protein
MASNAKEIIQDFSSVRLDLDNEPQPDALLRIETECGGQSHISAVINP